MEEKYSDDLYFTVSLRSNDLPFEYNKDKQSIASDNIYKMILSLKDKGVGLWLSTDINSLVV